MVTSCLNLQPDTSPINRAIMIDWLILLHEGIVVDVRESQSISTLFLASNMIDRYIGRVRIGDEKLQLLGVSAMMVAMKHDMLTAMSPNVCSYWTNRTYSAEEVAGMEIDMLMVLDWRVSIPTAATFMDMYWIIVKAHQRIKDASQFYLECTLLFDESLEYKPSDLAMSALVIAIQVIDIPSYHKELQVRV